MIIEFPTREDHIIDLLFTNVVQFFTKPVSLPPLDRSDHVIISLDLIYNRKIQSSTPFDYYKLDYNSLSLLDRKFFGVSPAQESMVLLIMHHIYSTISKKAPLVIKKKITFKPWFNADLIRL